MEMKCKKFWAKQLLSVAITSVLFSTAQAAPAGVNGNAAVDLVPAMGVGWNLGNSLDAYHPRKEWAEETVWHNPRITPELIQAVHEAGFNTIRIPITYIGRVENGPAYTIDADYLARIKEVVDYAYNEGMYVIINIHHDGGGDWEHGAWLNCEAADQTAVKKKFQAMWYQIADKFKDYDQHLLFEGMNEIHEHQNWNAPKKAQSMKNLNAYNQLFLDTVRKTGGKNNDRVLVVAGYNTNINFTTDAKYGFVLPKDSVDNRLMIMILMLLP